MRNLLFAATALGGLALASPSQATLQVAADFGGTTFLCVDNGSCDTDLSTGTIQIANQTIGGITVNGSVQTSTGTPANPGTDILNTSSLNLINTLGIAVAYTVTISDTNFTAPVNQFSATTSGTFRTAPTHVEEMYEPEVFGRTGSAVVTVQP